MSDVEAIQTWLQTSYSLQVPPDWLSACVEWIQQEHASQPVSARQLQAMVFEQWLMSDLRELGSACLPSDLSTQLSTQVNGPLALQVESMLDIGVPLYGQLQKVKGTLNVNVDVSADKPQQPAWEPKPSRMMLLKMTDGVTEVQGMEYHPIPALTPDLLPGFKVIVQGTVCCRRGMLMLTSDNMQVLGGEVDSLMETNTPLHVLQQAMDLNTTNNGKSAKKDFSGRFINKQDRKLGSDDHKKFKQETNTQFSQRPSSSMGVGDHKAIKQETRSQLSQRPAPGTHRPGGVPAGGSSWCPGPVKKESQTQQYDTLDDEWDEDLDYEGVLQTFDEPMEEESGQSTSKSSHSGSTAAPAKVPSATHRNNPFACVSGSSGGQPNTARPLSVPAWNTSVKDDSFGSFWNANSVQSGGRVTNQNVRNNSEQPSSFRNEDGDDMWGDDDDLELMEADSDFMSPVIPIQTSVSENTHSAKVSNSSHPIGVSLGGSGKQGDTRSDSQMSGSSMSLSKPKVVTNFSRTDSSKTKSGFPQNSSSSLRPPSSQTSSSADAKPPPAKQRKLTTMFSKMKQEPAKPQSVPNATVDLTECDVSPPTGDQLMLKQRVDNLKQERKDSCDRDQDCGDVQQTDQTKATHNSGDDVQSVPKAVVSPFTSQDEGVSSREPQSLKEVLALLQSGTGLENSVTIKGYITTLTDRLRSCQGERWSLACRVTDGTATTEVSIADQVLAGLIGFTAKESITLRQQARKDVKVKDFLSEGLQKCQKALVEFSGLMDLCPQQGDPKPELVSMLQLETKKR